MRIILVSFTSLLVGCQSTAFVPPPSCPQGEPIEDVVPFTADDVVALADVTYDTLTNANDEFPEPLPVHAEVTYEVAGDPEVVDLGTPENELCLAGLALRVPVTEHRRGTVNGWAYAQEEPDLAILATSAALDALTVVYLHGTYEFSSVLPATVDPELRSAPDACGDRPADVHAGTHHDPWGGSWALTREMGGISHICPGDSSENAADGGSFVNWGEYPEGYNPFGANPHTESNGE